MEGPIEDALSSSIEEQQVGRRRTADQRGADAG
jgi:hypothetical protein